MKIRIALDQSVGRRRAIELVDIGYLVVAIARHGESDESWMNRAFAEGAQFAISPDLDIPRLIEKHEYPMAWINYPSDDDAHKGDLVGYIDRRVKSKMDLFRDMVAEPPKKKGEKKPWFTRFLSSTK